MQTCEHVLRRKTQWTTYENYYLSVVWIPSTWDFLILLSETHDMTPQYNLICRQLKYTSMIWCDHPITGIWLLVLPTIFYVVKLVSMISGIVSNLKYRSWTNCLLLTLLFYRYTWSKFYRNKLWTCWVVMVFLGELVFDVISELHKPINWKIFPVIIPFELSLPRLELQLATSNNFLSLICILGCWLLCKDDNLAFE